MVGLKEARARVGNHQEAPWFSTPLCLQQLRETSVWKPPSLGDSQVLVSGPENLGQGGGAEVRTPHQAQVTGSRGTTVQKRKQTCQDGVMASKPCRQQATRPPSWQLTDPSTQTSTRGTTWEGTRYCHAGQRSQQKHNQRLLSHPLCPRPEPARCVQQREKKQSRPGKT